MDWVKVEDKTPNDLQVCWVWDDGEPSVGQWLGGVQSFIGHSGSDSLFAMEVTHWSKIEPPTGETSEEYSSRLFAEMAGRD